MSDLTTGCPFGTINCKNFWYGRGGYPSFVNPPRTQSFDEGNARIRRSDWTSYFFNSIDTQSKFIVTCNIPQQNIYQMKEWNAYAPNIISSSSLLLLVETLSKKIKKIMFHRILREVHIAKPAQESVFLYCAVSDNVICYDID